MSRKHPHKDKPHKDKKPMGMSPPSVSNFCSSCKKDLGGNITPIRIHNHECKKIIPQMFIEPIQSQSSTENIQSQSSIENTKEDTQCQ